MSQLQAPRHEPPALSPGWHVALSEAWEAYLHGSYPIGACVVDADGNVIARGRNRIGEPRGVVNGAISGHDLAHAEINALLDIKEKIRPDCYSWTLLSTLQPCPQCAAAVAMNSMKHIQYAAPDAWVADSNLLTHDPYVARKGIQVTRAPEQVQRLALRLTLVGFLEAHHDMNGPFITSFRAYPDDVQFAHHLHETGQLAALRERRAALEEVLALLDGHA